MLNKLILVQYKYSQTDSIAPSPHRFDLAELKFILSKFLNFWNIHVQV